MTSQRCPSCGSAAYVGATSVECSSLRCFLHPRLHHVGVARQNLVKRGWDFYDELDRDLRWHSDRPEIMQAAAQLMDALIGGKA